MYPPPFLLPFHFTEKFSKLDYNMKNQTFLLLQTQNQFDYKQTKEKNGEKTGDGPGN